MANNIKIIGNTVLVSKTFYNKATTYGTTEFFEWMKILNIKCKNGSKKDKQNSAQG